MAFVNERIPDEEKEQFKDLSRWKNPVTGRQIEIYKWTIDRERDVFFIPLGGYGGRPGMPDYFVLSWHGAVIEIDGCGEASGNAEKGVVVFWNIANVVIPRSLESKSTEVIELVKEAMEASGWVLDRDFIKEVNFKIKRIIFI